MELKEQDDTESSEESEKDDWGVMISRIMKSYPSMSLEAVMNLSYPQFKILYTNIYNEKTFNIVVPFLGSSEESKEGNNQMVKKEINNKGKESNIIEINSIISQMNKEFAR